MKCHEVIVAFIANTVSSILQPVMNDIYSWISWKHFVGAMKASYGKVSTMI